MSTRPRFCWNLVLCASSVASSMFASDFLVTPRQNVPSGVQVRRSANLNARELPYALPFGQRMRSKGKVGDWYTVITPAGTEGYACADVLEVVRPEDIEFQVTFLDVGNGDAAVINTREADIVIDGGANPDLLARLVRNAGLIRNGVELMIVTSDRYEHWGGLIPFAREGAPPVLELWVPEIDTLCPDLGYREFRAASDRMSKTCIFRHSELDQQRGGSSRNVSTCVARTIRPHPRRSPAFDVKLPFIPEVDITVLHRGLPRPNAGYSCGLRRDSASLVLLLQIGDQRLLFTSDMPGKVDGEDSNRQPTRYVEEELLAMEGKEKGLLRVNLLKVPNHGADTASTPDFIGKLLPAEGKLIAVVSSLQTAQNVVLQRYPVRRTVIRRTDPEPDDGNNHVVCTKRKGRDPVCEIVRDPRRLTPLIAPAKPRTSAPAIVCGEKLMSAVSSPSGPARR